MSPLSSERVRLRVSPGAVQASLWRGWPKPRSVAVQEARVDAAAAAPSLLATAAHALEALAHSHPIAGRSLEVELSDRLVHYDLARGDFRGHSERQLGSVADACIAELLGDAASQFRVRWQLLADERHLLLCAVPSDLVEGIADLARQRKLRLARMQAAFVSLWNERLPRPLPARCVLARACASNAIIAYVERGVILSLGNGPWQVGRNGSTPPAEAAAAFDLHVDRLLASQALDADPQPAFLLERTGTGAPPVSSRWVLMSTPATKGASA